MSLWEVISLDEVMEVESPSLSQPCEDTARRWPSESQEEGPHQNPTVLAP